MELSLHQLGHQHRISSLSSSNQRHLFSKHGRSYRKKSSILCCFGSRDVDFSESVGRRALVGLVFAAAAGLNMCHVAEAASSSRTALKGAKVPESEFTILPNGLKDMENITASELAGFGVGALLLFATISASKVDAFISASERRSLGMCKKCGDLRMIACSRCKGSGLIGKEGLFGFSMVADFSQLFQDEGFKSSLIRCNKCLSKGCLPCPECSKSL